MRIAAQARLRLPYLSVVESGWRAELAARATELLGRFGVAGRVEVEGQLVWLIGNGPTVEVGLPELATTSAAQTPVELQRLAERLARELAAARRSALAKSETTSDWIGLLKVVPPIALVILVLGFAVRYLLPPGAPPKALNVPAPASANRKQLASHADVEQQKQEQQLRNCLEVVGRIQRGGSVTALDADGWVVELSLIADDAYLEPNADVLKDYFESLPSDIERRQIWPGAPTLLKTDASSAGILVSKEPLAQAAPVNGSGIKVTWRGTYAAQYFKEFERREFVRLADSLYRDTNARYGALYARCAQGVARYLGAWFRGPTVGGAVWSLVAELDVFSDTPHVAGIKPGDGPEQWAPPLNRLAQRARSITRKQAAFILANAAGGVSESPGHHATLEFPFAQGSRANLASQKFVDTLLAK